MKRLDLVANICVIITSLMFLVFIGNFIWEGHHGSLQTQAGDLVGTKVVLSGLDFSPQGKTLLIVVSSSCEFCRASEPFYRQLVNSAGLKTRIVAVVPMPQSDAESYVHTSISPLLQVVSASLDSVSVQATPTLLLVNSQGLIEKAWVGKLTGAEEMLLRSQL